jgi:hypothetical protein
MRPIPFILQGKNIVVFIGGQPTTVTESHLNYDKLRDAIKASDWAAVPALVTVRKTLSAYTYGRVSISDNDILFDGKPIHNALSSRMLNAFKEGFPIDHFSRFMENLDANPSYRARNELVGFLDACELPITDDGCFMAYKKIRADWKDCYSGTIDNSIGQKPTMARRDVNEDPNQTCSAGLHVCSYSYLSRYSGERIVAVKIDPADVVSCPVDYNNSKLRVCAYEVVEELAFEAAQKNDVLSAGLSVVTGFARDIATERPADYFSKSLEDIFCEFSADDTERVIAHFSEQSTEFGYCCMHGVGDFKSADLLLEVLLRYFTFTEIRNNLRKLFA